MELCESSLSNLETVLEAPLETALQFLCDNRIKNLNSLIEIENSLKRKP